MTQRANGARSLPHVAASCHDCPWSREEGVDGSHAAVRMAARRHAEREGHEVVATFTHTITWNGR